MRPTATFLLALLLAASPGLAQEARPLALGQPIPDTLDAEATHRYTLAVDSGTFVYGAVDQLDVDVVVRVLDPDGEQVRRWDGPARGPERFQFESEASGAFVIEVSPFEEQEGAYVIELVRVEPVATDPEARVDQLLVGYSGDDTPGAAVGVVIDGELRFAKGYGMANLEHGIPFGVGTISNIGSVTKQFTAMGLLLLEAEGRLSLDDDIRTHVPELKDFGHTITLRNLLNHTGGYREIYNLLPMAGFRGEDAVDRDVAIQIVQRQPELQALPNTEFNYNNTGYILLATTIERVTGATFPEYMEEAVFEPLGMSDTRVKAYQGEVIPGSAQGYVPAEEGGYRAARDLPASYGAGGIYTTLADLTTWMMNYRDGMLGGSGAVSAITTRTILESGDTSSYGLGMGIGEVRGRTIYTHTGGDVAHRAYFGYYPELESGVLLLSNNGTFDLGLNAAVARAFLGDRFDTQETVAETEAPEAADMSPERMEAIAGDWVIEAPTGATLDIVYSVEDGTVFAQATGQPRFQLTPTSDSTLAFVGVEASVTFHFEADGTVNRATHHQGGTVPMRRIERAELTAEELAAFTGRYFSAELETFYELRVEDGELMAHHLRMEPFALNHREGDDFASGQFFFATVAFQRSEDGAVTGFMASNGRTRDVWFEKR